jgi:hypothetical protein
MWPNTTVGAVNNKVDNKEVAAVAMRARWFMTSSKNSKGAGVAVVSLNEV